MDKLLHKTQLKMIKNRPYGVLKEVIYFSVVASQPKALIKVSKVSWTSQLSYEIRRYVKYLDLHLKKFDKTNFISQKNTFRKPASFRVKLKIVLYQVLDNFECSVYFLRGPCQDYLVFLLRFGIVASSPYRRLAHFSWSIQTAPSGS